MDPAPGQFAVGSDAGEALAKRLRAAIRGDVRFDALSRAIWATDASIYQIVPLGVVLPKNLDEVSAVVRACHESDTPIVARGAGTGLTGGAIGAGLVLDLSRYMNRIGPVDRETRTIEVEPGVVLDELNAHLSPYGLQFAPDVATGSRATLGGMIANNSCGARSIIYGRTVDHVLELTVVLADGDSVTFGLEAGSHLPQDRVARIETELARIRDESYPEIERRFPKVLRSNGGYGLDRLGPPGTRAEAIRILCGSEGTLGIVVRAKLKLVEIPPHTGLVVLHFRSVFDALGATPAAVKHKPAAVELIDSLILEAGRANPATRDRCDFLLGDRELPNDAASALLLVECSAESAAVLSSNMDELAGDADLRASSFAVSKLIEPNRQQDVWELRKSGLGLLMSRPGDDQPLAFVEDSAVDPNRLREYIDRFTSILKSEDVKAGYYAHAGAGCIHVRPILNLKQAKDVERMRRIAEAVSELALEFGGAMTGEHGDGIVRSCWLEKMYGPKITAAFQEVKDLFDPKGLLNPHKIVAPYSMTERLRYGPGFQAKPVKTHLDFSAYGGMAGLAGMCSGVGQCRQRLTGTMCPSYMATSDERHTTRARANALRIALSNHDLLSGLDDPQLAEVMDLCLSCKACKAECPTGVDIARLKAEYLSRQNLLNGVSRRSRFIAEMPGKLAVASRFPRLSNLLMQSRVVRGMIERRYGLDRRIPPPRFARRTFRAWFRHHTKERAANFSQRAAGFSLRGDPRVPEPTDHSRGVVVYFVDCWTNYFVPQIGIAAVTLLERVGFRVHCPRTFCCQRPAISRGLLTEARHVAEANVCILTRVAGPGVPIVGTEPSCILTIVDEYPQLVRTNGARRIASQAMMLETLLHHVLRDDPGALTFTPRAVPLRYHGHCHQKAIVGSNDAAALLHHAWGDAATEIDGGCCGMAGSFGHEVEHYDVARAIGEQRLFPAVRDRGNAEVAVSGFSCRQQIEHHTGAPVRHIVEYLADALACARLEGHLLPEAHE